MAQTDNLDDWFPRDGIATLMPGMRLGVVVGGSLSKGLEVKLDRGNEIEDLAVGRYVVIRGARKRFFCMVTDISLDNTNPAIKSDPPDLTDPARQAQLTDQQIAAVIKQGRGQMPAFDLPDPTVTGVIKLVRLLNASGKGVAPPASGSSDPAPPPGGAAPPAGSASAPPLGAAPPPSRAPGAAPRGPLPPGHPVITSPRATPPRGAQAPAPQ